MEKPTVNKTDVAEAEVGKVGVEAVADDDRGPTNQGTNHTVNLTDILDKFEDVPEEKRYIIETLKRPLISVQNIHF